jgi:RND family efflux transporter MFP subunit
LRKNWKYFLPLIVVAVLGGIITFRNASGDASKDPRRSNAPLVKVDKPIRELVQYRLRFNGDVVAYQQATIYARVTGNLEKVTVALGSIVQAQQVLARIDSLEPYDQVQQMAATYEKARLSYQRSRSLLSGNLISKQDVDNLDASMKVAKANYELAKTRLGYTRILAPFAGIITKRFLDPGTYLASSNTPLFQLMYIDSVKILINIQEKDVTLVRKGTRAEISVDSYGSKLFTGSVSRLADALDLSTRSMAVEIDIPNEDHSLKPGMFATVRLVVGEHPDAVTVPTIAIQKDDSGSYVFVSDNNAAKRKRIQIGIDVGAKTEVVSGLDGSESIIVVGQQLVKDGGQINIQK